MKVGFAIILAAAALIVRGDEPPANTAAHDYITNPDLPADMIEIAPE